ncbi:uncharacterized protein C8Q71DRAFT_762421 [Rhodofomes roseus]|uniref:Uncharacterized protein n=1 Tax=Rhodofomes roseus TaxID=34475 RepID=A0ABQ8KGN2_9APHY|nr:uncharacterized protein C8Q71DRAFT_762421 [Rhodofomes roseus]KAH9836402.1 hypothetical protein C8Q71DRAFT_762421 [Rhodofomes roseus]
MSQLSLVFKFILVVLPILLLLSGKCLLNDDVTRAYEHHLTSSDANVDAGQNLLSSLYTGLCDSLPRDYPVVCSFRSCIDSRFQLRDAAAWIHATAEILQLTASFPTAQPSVGVNDTETTLTRTNRCDKRAELEEQNS